ncbi:hypothetical protein ZWY2020_019269 [Hordeum vulgare]|nr:hypothetical protein ZWY2020_019269 [Hordeum vulgare]
MKEYSLDDDDAAGAGLVLCKIYVSGHKKEITYASLINAPGSKKKRKPADVQLQHPEAPRPKTPRRQEAAAGMLHEFERSFMSDQDQTLPQGVVDDGSVDPGGFFTDMREELGLTLQGNTNGGGSTLEESLAGKQGDVHQGVESETVQEDVDGRFQCTWDEMFGDDVQQVTCPAPATAPSLHVSSGLVCV